MKKGKVTLTTEPTVARGVCVSTPVFTLGGTTASKKLGGNGTFTFTHTFLGNKFDKIHGRFVSTNEVEGFAIYHFPAQDLCSAGKAQVNFTAQAASRRRQRPPARLYATMVSAPGSTEKSSSVYSPM